MGYVRDIRALVGNRPLILVGSNVLIIDERGRVLLQRRVDSGLWGMIGGIMEPGETLEAVARREVREETGLDVDDLTLIDFYSGAEYFDVYPSGDQVYPVGAVYVARSAGGQPRPDRVEAEELRYFSIDTLPAGMATISKLVLTNPGVQARVRSFVEETARDARDNQPK